MNVTTAMWADMWEGAHAHAFTVAGATSEALLLDLRGLVDQAIASGITLEEFRRQFDDLAEKHGWDYRGKRGWRTKVIYETNLRTSYSTGRYQQMTDPDVLAYRPYWMWVHSDISRSPRPQHKDWNGKVWAATDKEWSWRWPPCGWGCRCRVEALSRRDLAKMGKTGPDPTEPPIPVRRTVYTSAGPRTVSVPQGVDPGWGYSPGEAAFGRGTAERVLDDWRGAGRAKWATLPVTGARKAAAELPLDPTNAGVGQRLTDPAKIEAAAVKAMGGQAQRTYFTADGLAVAVDAKALAAGLDPEAARLLPLLPGLLERPAEIWAAFDRHQDSGQVVLRRTLLRRTKIGDRDVMLAATVRQGRLESLEIVDPGAVRQGALLWSRGDADRWASAARAQWREAAKKAEAKTPKPKPPPDPHAKARAELRRREADLASAKAAARAERDNAKAADLWVRVQQLRQDRDAALDAYVAATLDADTAAAIARGRQVADEIAAEAAKAGKTHDPQWWRARIVERLQAERGAGTGRLAALRVPDAFVGGDVRRVAATLPRSWIDRLNRSKSVLHARFAGTTRAWCATARDPTEMRDHAGETVRLHLDDGMMLTEDDGTTLHELVHWVQNIIPHLDRFYQALHKRRTKGDPLRPLRDITGIQGYRPDEKARPDGYIDAYYGKEYGSRGALEMITMAVQHVLGTDGGVSRILVLRRDDPEMLHMTLGLLFGFDPL